MTATGSGCVVLRPVGNGDWPAVHAWASQERVCRYFVWGPNTAEQTHPDYWGKGLATAAARQLVQLGFDEHDLHRIFATCDPRNIASAAVLQRLGMQYEGRMRETTLIRDGWRDSDLYSVLVDEWMPVPFSGN
jgi:[ribosomal protein S5]-alanine N-acetyltransferase